MKITKKSNEEIQGDKDLIKKDREMQVIRKELYWTMTEENYWKYLKKSKKLNRQREVFEKDWVLIIRICENKSNHTNTDTWLVTTVQNSIIEFWDYKEYLFRHKTFNWKNIKSLKFFIQHDNWNYELSVPEEDSKNILEYLIDGKPPIEFNCQSFIHQAKGVKMRWHWENFSIIADKRIMWRRQPNELKAWDCVCMFKAFANNDETYKWVQHFAYYIWSWLFISKFWTTWSLCISNMQEMHNFYGTREFVSMAPNPNHEDTPTINNK